MRNRIIETRETLETELIQLNYLIKNFNNKLYPNGDGIPQFIVWLKMRKKVREKLIALPKVKDIQRGCLRINVSNSYSPAHQEKRKQWKDLCE